MKNLNCCFSQKKYSFLMCSLDHSFGNFILKYQLSFCWLSWPCQKVVISNSQGLERFSYSIICQLTKEIDVFACTKACVSFWEEFEVYKEMKGKCTLLSFESTPIYMEHYSFFVYEWQKRNLFSGILVYCSLYHMNHLFHALITGIQLKLP
jgi:hypothetical protein